MTTGAWIVAGRGSSTGGRVFARYFGWVVLGIALIWWGRLDPTVTAVLVLTAALYIGFRTPTWCGAITRRQQICRNNAHGVMMGCHLREHRWQKLRLAIVPKSWSALWGRLWRTDKMQALGLVVASFGALFGGLQALGTFVSGAQRQCAEFRATCPDAWPRPGWPSPRRA
jgi:hypothetical protein